MKHAPNDLKKNAHALRALSMDMVQKAHSGHPGMPLGMADVAATLFLNHITIDPSHPKWANRDRFVLSAGHGSALLYSLLHVCSYPGVDMESLKNFRKLHSPTPGHPEYGHTSGVETTTGPLGQGLATAVGMALSQKLLAARLGENMINYKTYVMASDGDLMEGISQEAISLAGHLNLNSLIVLWDDNDISIDGPLDLCCSDDQLKRFQASGWHTLRIDGHDYEAIDKALTEAKASDKPTLIACKTVIGFGAPNKQGKSESHGAPLGEEEIRLTREALEWTYEPFFIPTDIYKTFEEAMNRGKQKCHTWMQAHDKKFTEFLEKQRPSFDNCETTLNAIKDHFLKHSPEKATRQLSQDVLSALLPIYPALLGGSADLSGSNNTKTSHHTSVSKQNFQGNYINYGIREHAMAAIANGLALCDCWIPYVATFLVFSDYLRPALRLSALMKKQVLYILTHDSIGLGEDGPTHQPIEHLSALIAIPGVKVIRPGDPIEVVEAYKEALHYTQGPTVIVLTRQNVKPFRHSSFESGSFVGAYALTPLSPDQQICLMASGSEVSLALEVAALLEKEHSLLSRVISVPNIKEFIEKHPRHERESLLGNQTFKVAIEASNGWHFQGISDLFIGMEGFGASAPAEDLYEHFGLSAKAIVQKIADHLLLKKA